MHQTSITTTTIARKINDIQDRLYPGWVDRNTVLAVVRDNIDLGEPKNITISRDPHQSFSEEGEKFVYRFYYETTAAYYEIVVRHSSQGFDGWICYEKTTQKEDA